MANRYIGDLVVTASLNATDVFVVDTGERYYKVPFSTLKSLIGIVSNMSVNNTAGTITITLTDGSTFTVTPHDPTKQDKLTFDVRPTANSSNPVTSSGIKAALDEKVSLADYVPFTGATAIGDGTIGLVPLPEEQHQYLTSDGTWESPDTQPVQGSAQLITSGAVYAAIAAIVTIQVDTVLSEVSESPVQNKVITQALNNKVDKVAGKGLSSEDYTAAEKTKLAGIESGAQVNTVTGIKGDNESTYRDGNVNITKGNVGLGNVDNTSDSNKPVSTDQQAALDLKLDKSNVYNGLDKTDSGYALDARQGKALSEDLANTVHVNSAQTFTEQEKYQARQNIGAISANEVEHKRFGVSGVGQSSPTLTRLYDAVGMTATPSTDVTEGSSDFDNFAPFNRRKCVGNWTAGTNKAVFNVQAYEGDADYAEDGSMGDYVAVEVEPFYYYDQDGILAVSTYQWPGYKIHPVCVDYDGNIRAKTYLPVYALAQDANGKAVSLPGYQNQRGGYNDLRNYAKTYSDTGAAAYAMIEPSAVWHYEWLLMTIEFATTNMQNIMYGAASMRYADDKIVAVPGANMIVIGSTGSNFVVGQTIYMGASYGASVNVRTEYNRITAIEKCNADGTLNPSGSYYRFTYDGTDRSASIVVNTWAVSTRPWCTGATAGYAPGVNAVKGHTGSPVSNTSGKYAMRYRWRENVYGNQNMTTLDLADLRVADGDSFHLDWYFLADPRKYVPYGNYGKADIQNTAKGWVKLGVNTPVANYVSNYVKELIADATYPWVKIPVTGATSTTYFCDYASLVNSPEVRCVRRGGYVSYGAYAGPCFFTAYDHVSSANWAYGATLYFLQ